MRAVKTLYKATGKQSISEIAKKYGLSGDTLAAAVGLDVNDVPEKGQQIPIPPPFNVMVIEANRHDELFRAADGSPDPSIVKSAHRVLRIFEYFAEIERPELTL